MLPMVARYVAFAFLCLLTWTNRHKKARYSVSSAGGTLRQWRYVVPVI